MCSEKVIGCVDGLLTYVGKVSLCYDQMTRHVKERLMETFCKLFPHLHLAAGDDAPEG